MPLDTVSEYIMDARVILQDKTVPLRYTDQELASAVGLGLLEMRKLRADLFFGRETPNIKSTTALTTRVEVDEQYRVPLLYWIIGHTLLRNEEEGSDSQAAGYLNRFTAKLLTIAS